jgi:hypothetical protein
MQISRLLLHCYEQGGDGPRISLSPILAKTINKFVLYFKKKERKMKTHGHKDLYVSIHSSFIHNRPNLGKKPMCLPTGKG